MGHPLPISAVRPGNELVAYSRREHRPYKVRNILVRSEGVILLKTDGCAQGHGGAPFYVDRAHSRPSKAQNGDAIFAGMYPCRNRRSSRWRGSRAVGFTTCRLIIPTNSSGGLAATTKRRGGRGCFPQGLIRTPLGQPD